MKESILSILGIGGCLAITTAGITEWVSLICTLTITIVTCGISAYRLIRDRDLDKKSKKIEEKKEDEKEN